MQARSTAGNRSPVAEPIVVASQLAKRYGPVAALEDCSLRVERGEVFGLLGPNGAGKTTLLRLLLGFLRPSAGRATIAGLDCLRQSLAVRRIVSYLPGEVRLFRALRGRAVLRFFSALRGDGSFDRAVALADRLRLDLTRPVAFMSTGMRQKLGLAAVLAADVPLYVLDEPTSNLDPTVRRQVLEIVRQRRAAGATILFSSHVLSEVEEVCDRVAILRAGRLVHLQSLGDLRRQHRIRAVAHGPLPPPPATGEELHVSQAGDGQVTILASGALSPLLSWLASCPLAEVHIEPVGLQAVYERFHGEPELATSNPASL
jgi:ABC-2 type transport system ATP-binding protein